MVAENVTKGGILDTISPSERRVNLRSLNKYNSFENTSVFAFPLLYISIIQFLYIMFYLVTFFLLIYFFTFFWGMGGGGWVSGSRQSVLRIVISVAHGFIRCLVEYILVVVMHMG